MARRWNSVVHPPTEEPQKIRPGRQRRARQRKYLQVAMLPIAGVAIASLREQHFLPSNVETLPRTLLLLFGLAISWVWATEPAAAIRERYWGLRPEIRTLLATLGVPLIFLVAYAVIIAYGEFSTLNAERLAQARKEPVPLVEVARPPLFLPTPPPAIPHAKVDGESVSMDAVDITALVDPYRALADLRSILREREREPELVAAKMQL